MIKHVFRLVWNRKRTTGLVTLEILICYLVLCTVLATGAYMLSLWQRPLGFNYENVWYVNIGGRTFTKDDSLLQVYRSRLDGILRSVRTLPEVQAAAASYNLPYSGSTWIDGTWIKGEEVGLQPSLCTPQLIEVFGMEVHNGRWLTPEDAALEHQPVVLTAELAEGLFPDSDPIGQDLPRFNKDGKLLGPGEKAHEDDPEPVQQQVVGVIGEYRRFGELSGYQTNMVFQPYSHQTGKNIPDELVIRVQPGTTAMFEEKLVRTMQDAVGQWSYSTELLEARRSRELLEYLSPLLVMSVVAIFLVLMVGLGLMGVLWLNVTRRTSELGLRRAMGASGNNVRGQVLGELWALTTLAVVAGGLLFVQVPLFGIDFGAGHSWSGYVIGMLAAAVVIFTIVTICGLYPAWLATRVRPAQALQYE